MSILSDALSRVKYSKPKGDVPPGLRNTITELKSRESKRRAILFIGGFVGIAVITGILTYSLLMPLMPRPESNRNFPQGNNRRQIVHAISVKQLEPVIATAETRTPATSEAKIPEAVRQPEVIIPEKATRQGKKTTKKTHDVSEMKKLLDELKGADSVAVPDNRIDDAQIAKNEEKWAIAANLYSAMNYENKAEYSNAMESYKKILEIEPDNYKVMNNIGSILIKINLYEEAKIYLQKALAVKSDYVPGLINMGVLLAKVGEAENAAKYLLQALNTEPDNKQALLNMAILYEKQGYTEKAREYYTKLQRLGGKANNIGRDRP